jgi:DTW domain-containing protein YfiP
MRARNLPICSCSGLAAAACPGADLRRIDTRVAVVIVSHRIELQRTSNTGRLLGRVLSRCEQRVHAEGEPAPESLTGSRKLLLFPSEGARVLEPADGAACGTVLVVPDGTWAQARRIVRRDALLQGAEPVSLPPGPGSRYRLRCTVGEGRLSTYEAVARAMGILQGNETQLAMEALFDRFVERMLSTRWGG